jgi:hypothetical protein
VDMLAMVLEGVSLLATGRRVAAIPADKGRLESDACDTPGEATATVQGEIGVCARSHDKERTFESMLWLSSIEEEPNVSSEGTDHGRDWVAPDVAEDAGVDIRRVEGVPTGVLLGVVGGDLLGVSLVSCERVRNTAACNKEGDFVCLGVESKLLA